MGASKEGAGACPAAVTHGGASPACGICARPSLRKGHPAEMSRPVPLPGSAAACVTLLLGCAWLSLATQFSPSKCRGGSGGVMGQGREALLGHPDIASRDTWRG